MASKRALRKKSCEGKIRFATNDNAMKAAVSYMRKFGGWMKPYRCRFCGHYHIGHPSRRIKLSIISQRGQR
jgi:hypothetical protein